MKVWLRQKRNSLGEFSQNWNDTAAKTENDIVFKKTCRIRSNLGLRQKMMYSWNKFVEIDLICGQDKK